SGPTGGVVATGGAIAELIILSLSGFILFRRCGNTVAESCAYGLIATLMSLSLVFQSAFLFHLPAASLVIETIVTTLALAFIVHRRSDLLPALTAIKSLWSRHPLMCPVIVIAWGYLVLLALVIPPDTIHWQSIARVLEFESHHTLFPAGVSTLTSGSQGLPASANILILPHLFLRFHGDAGLGLLGFAAYLSIGFSVYALSRRYAWPSTAFTVVVIVLSMPRMVYLATSPGYEIIPTAVALFCLLAVFRTVESPNVRDLYLLLLGMVFMISKATLQLTFPLVLVPLAGLLLFRRHGLMTWWHLVAARPSILLLFSVPALIFSPLLPLVHRLLANGDSEGTRILSTVVYNNDGLQGTAANVIRYLLQSIDLTPPVDNLLRWAMGFSVSGLLQRVYESLVAPVFDGRGAAAAFRIAWGADERFSWFGPFGFVLILPAVVYAVRRAPRRLKAVAVALVGYFFLVALIPAWQPENVRYFDVFFLCGSVCTAFFLPPWRLSRRGRRVLMTIGAGLLVYAAACNEHKPAFTLPNGLASSGAGAYRAAPYIEGNRAARPISASGSIWTATDWGCKRCWAAPLIYGDDRVEATVRLVNKTERLGLIYEDYTLTYPFLRRFPAAETTPLGDVTPQMVTSSRGRRIAYLMFVDCSPPQWLAGRDEKLLWTATLDTAKVPGALIHLP
ncbi:MAG: hypothetical protein WCF40_00630, partial [Desulfobacterales bacterium]